MEITRNKWAEKVSLHMEISLLVMRSCRKQMHKVFCGSDGAFLKCGKITLMMSEWCRQGYGTETCKDVQRSLTRQGGCNEELLLFFFSLLICIDFVLHHLPLWSSIKVYLILPREYCIMKYGMCIWVVSGSIVRQLQMVTRRLNLTYITHKHKYSVCTSVCFQYSVYPPRTVPNMCFRQLFYKQSEKKKMQRTCQSRFWCTAALRHDWTPHHIILHKCQERWGQGDPVHLNCRAQNIVLGSFSAGSASQTVPSDLRLKLDQLHTSLPFHTAICPLFFLYLFNSYLSACLPFTLCHNTLCHNSPHSLLLWNWTSDKIPDRSPLSSDWLDGRLTCAEASLGYIMWHNSRGGGEVAAAAPRWPPARPWFGLTREITAPAAIKVKQMEADERRSGLDRWASNRKANVQWR